MKIETTALSEIILKEVFNPIVLQTESGETMVICMRDSGFEFTYQDKKYSAKNNQLISLSI
jgi:hypothetical protein